MIRNLMMLVAAALFATGTAAAQNAPAGPQGSPPGSPQAPAPPAAPQPPPTPQGAAPGQPQTTNATTNATEETGLGAGTFELAAIPIGGAVFLKSDDNAQPRFDSYVFGASATANFSRYFGVEGEATYAVGRSQTITTKDFSIADQKTPSLWLYNADLIVSPLGRHRMLVPYAAAGVGGLTLLNRPDTQPNSPDRGYLGFPNGQDSFFAANVGAGLKWFPIAHWGLRGDYRFVSFDTGNASNTGATPNRHANRVYGSVIFTY